MSPRQIAVNVQSNWGHDKVEPHLQYTSLEHLTQMARRVLGSRFDPESNESNSYQGELFTGNLQSHYPIPRPKEGDAVYKRTEFLTLEEIEWNVEKLRKSASARLRHADALQAWADSRRLRVAA